MSPAWTPKPWTPPKKRIGNQAVRELTEADALVCRVQQEENLAGLGRRRDAHEDGGKSRELIDWHGPSTSTTLPGIVLKPLLGVAAQRCSPFRHAIVCCDEVEALRIEPSTDPREHTVMLLVIGVADSFDERVVARVSANVFWRTHAPPPDDTRVSRFGLSLSDVLKNDVMLPAVPEIVFVDQTIPWMFKDPGTWCAVR
jgi:hypothetical protein